MKVELSFIKKRQTSTCESEDWAAELHTTSTSWLSLWSPVPVNKGQWMSSLEMDSRSASKLLVLRLTTFASQADFILKIVVWITSRKQHLIRQNIFSWRGPKLSFREQRASRTQWSLGRGQGIKWELAVRSPLEVLMRSIAHRRYTSVTVVSSTWLILRAPTIEQRTSTTNPIDSTY